MNISEYLLCFYDEVKHLDKNAIHSYVQDKLCDLASEFKFVGVKEYKCDYIRRNSNEVTKGRIDVVWLDVCDNIVFACELDSKVNYKSYIKLKGVNSKYKLWFYFGEECAKFYNSNNRYNNDNSITVITANFTR